MKKAVFTSCNLYYLDRALVLANSIKKHDIDVDFYLILSDYVDQEYFENDCFKSIDYVIDPCDVGIPDFHSWCFQYDVIEMCTAVKGYCLKFLLEEGYDAVIYLDPDIACFSSINFLFNTLKKHSIILTPHQLEPAKDLLCLKDHELAAHKYGIYNLGFVGASSSVEGHLFANWWSIRLRDFCLDDIPNGMFTDQKWCDAVPSYFSNYKIIRNYGCNVASWNLAERKIYIREDNIYVNNLHKLVFYHFTKYFKEGYHQTKIYAQTTDTISIWNWYGRTIKKVRSIMPKASRTNKYDYYEDGSPISAEDRRIFRSDPLAFNPNPFQKTLQS